MFKKILKLKNCFNSVSILSAALMLSVPLLAIYEGWLTKGGGWLPNHPDRAIWMDAAWRVTVGQIPHVDFVSPLGAGWLYLNAIPVMLLGPDYTMLPYVTAIFMLISTLLIWVLIRPISGRLFAILAVLYTQNIFRSQFLDYNEIALLLLYIIFASSVMTKNNKSVLLPIVAGAALSTLFFWKINFFVAALLVLAMFVIVYEKPKYWGLFFLAGGISVFLFFCMLIDWNLVKLFSQYKLAADIKGDQVLKNIFSIKVEFDVFKELMFYDLISFAIFFSMSKFHPQARYRLINGESMIWVIFAILILIQNALCISNASVWAPHLLPWTILLCGVWLYQFRMDIVLQEDFGAIEKKRISILCMLGISLLWINITFLRFTSIVEPSNNQVLPLSYQASVNDGLDLIRGLGSEKYKIATLGYSNPFPPLLINEPPKYMYLWLSVFDTINLKAPPDPVSLFSEVDLLMEPKWHSNSHAEIQSTNLKHVYGDYVSSNYKIATEDQYWKVWIKNGK